MKNYFDLRGEVAIVTGGAGLLGGRYVEALREQGVSVASFDIRLPEIPREGVLDLKVDITKKSQVKIAYDELVNKFGTPTILVNNAGIDIHPNASAADNGPFEDYPEKTWDKVLASHLKGALLMSQEFLRKIKNSGKNGSIINISSTYGVVSPDQSLYETRRKKGENFYKPVTYSVAKAGMLNFTRWLAEYCGSAGISVRVNTLVPGGVLAGQDEEFVREYSKRTMLGRMANSTEYNAAILFLASHKASSYMTGSTLVVDGGWTAK